MRKYLSVLVIVLALTFGTRQTDWAQSAPLPSPVTRASQAGPVVDGLALVVSTDKTTYVGGEAIVLNIALTNPTASTQYRTVVGSSSPLDLFDFDVYYEDEGKGPFTAFGRKRLKRPLREFNDPFSVYSLIVSPGKALSYRVVISCLFDMSRGGTYRNHCAMARAYSTESRSTQPQVSTRVHLQ